MSRRKRRKSAIIHRRKPLTVRIGNSFKPITDVSCPSLKFPETVYLLGSGPNGINYYSTIPKDSYVVAVNRAVLIPSVLPVSFDIDAWIVADYNVIQTLYYSTIRNKFKGIKIFSMEAAIRDKVFGKDNLPSYTFFQHPRSTRCSKYRVGMDDYQMEGTVGSVAVQILARKGVRRIITCGFDVSGDIDFQGELPKDHRHGSLWKASKFFDSTIGYFQSQGIEISSLSETKLQLGKSAECPYRLKEGNH